MHLQRLRPKQHDAFTRQDVANGHKLRMMHATMTVSSAADGGWHSGAQFAMTITLYHNPRCSKSRQTLALLEERGQTPTIIEYLKTPPDAATLRALLTKLELEPIDIMRTGEEAYKAARDAIQTMSPEEQIDWLAGNPSVLQRPIVVAGDRARIGRPPDSILEILP
jgi:arsenate reductase